MSELDLRKLDGIAHDAAREEVERSQIPALIQRLREVEAQRDAAANHAMAQAEWADRYRARNAQLELVREAAIAEHPSVHLPGFHEGCKLCDALAAVEEESLSSYIARNVIDLRE